MKFIAEYVRIQILELLRLPSFFLPLIALPAAFYLMIGVRAELPAAQILFSYLAFAMLGTMMFQFGVGIAASRNDPWSLYLLSLPVPSRVRVLSQLIAGLFFSVLFSVPLLVIGAVNGAVFAVPPERFLAGAAALLAGGLVHGSLGLALGYWLPARGAVPITNLIYFPLAFIGGLFGTLNLGALQPLHTFSPTGAWADLINSSLIGEFNGLALAILLGYFLLCGSVAVWGYRRVEQTQYR